MLTLLNCVATYFVLLSVFYLATRVYGYVQFLQHKSEILSDEHMHYAALMHYLQLVHATLTVAMSVAVIKLAR